MACNIKAITNEQPSLLGETLTKINAERAQEWYAYMQQPAFLAEFGDWIADYKNDEGKKLINPKRVDENGEPKLFLDSKYGTYYYRDSFNRKVDFPKKRSKLKELYTPSETRKITKLLAFNFLSDRISTDFNTLDLTQKNVSLRKSIEQKLKEKIEELAQYPEDSYQRVQAELLNESTAYTYEWVQNVENYFKEIDLKYLEEQPNEEETRTGQQWGKASFERNSKANVTSNVRLRLSLLKQYDKKDDVFYEPLLKEYDAVRSDLLEVLTGQVAVIKDGKIEDLFEIYKKNIENLVEKKPYLQELVDLLNDPKVNDNLKAQFVGAFKLDRNNFIGSRIARNKNSITYIVQELSNTGSKSSFVKSTWNTQFQDKYRQKNGKYDLKKLAEIRTRLLKQIDEYKNDVIKAKKQNDPKTMRLAYTKANEVLVALGITVDQTSLDHYLDGLDPARISPELRAQNLLTLLETADFFLEALVKQNINPARTNPFNSETEFTKLANSEAFFKERGSDASIQTGGKSKWIYSYTSYISNRIKQWKKAPELLQAHYNTSKYNEGSHWMYQLLALDVDPAIREKTMYQRLDEFDVAILNSMQDDNKANSQVDGSDIAKDDFYGDTFNKMLGFRRGPGAKTYISTPTPADKGTLKQLVIPSSLMVDAKARRVSGDVKVSEQAKEIIFKYVLAEHERMKDTARELKAAEVTGDRSGLKSYYHLGPANGLRFQLMPSLNVENFDPDSLGFNLYGLEGEVLTDFDLTIPSIKPKIMDMIEGNLVAEVTEMENKLQELGMIEWTEKGPVNKAFDSAIWKAYTGTNEEILTKIAGDLVVNGLIGQVEYAKMFSGDVAYYKDVVDYKKRIPGTYVDGQDLYLKPGDETFKVAVIDSVEIPTPYLDNIKEIAPELVEEYKSINAADAQAWITPARWKFLKQALGKWEAIDDIVWDKMTGKNKEPFEKNELKRVAQPLKGVYFEINEGAPVYLKYSQAVLVPNLVKGNPQLEGLLRKMENAGVDELVTFDGIKVGANESTTLHNEDGSMKDSADYDFSPITLLNSGWKLQQDLPTKGFGQIAVGSQIQKNIFTGLSYYPDSLFNVAGTEMSGSDLIDRINSIVTGLSDAGLRGLEREFGVNEKGQITNIDRLNKSLIEQLKARGASPNIVEALENNVSPYGIPGYKEKIDNIWASMVLDRIVKIKTNGAALIQMSNFGINNQAEAEEQGVIWTPWAKKGETAQEYRYLRDAKGELILSESGKPIVRPAGILLPGSLIAPHIPNYRKYANNPAKLFGTFNPETNKYEGGMIDQAILENIIGYRIPNQVLASNEALEVVGILPEEMGDTVVAYTGITKKTGSDFDIDKMYLMVPSFKRKYTTASYRKAKAWLREFDLTEEELKKELAYDNIDYREDFSKAQLFNLVVEELLMNPLKDSTIKQNFEAEVGVGEVSGLEYIKPTGEVEDMTTAQLQNALIESYKAVLTNPDTIGEVLNPIDSEFIKNDITFLNPKKSERDFAAFNVNNEIESRYEFFAGKAGVGQTANGSVDLARGSMAMLALDRYYIGMGYRTKDSSGKLTTMFDQQEYSQELTDKELREYVEDYNNSLPEGAKPITYDEIKKYKSVKQTHTFSALMNGFVDIAKDPFITRGNWTTQTSNVGFMLLRAGVHPFVVNAMLAQPIIKEYVKYVTHSESILQNNSGDLFEKFMDKKIMERLGQESASVTNLNSGNTITKTKAQAYQAAKTYGEGAIVFSTAKLGKLFKVNKDHPEVAALAKEFKELNAELYGIDNYDFDAATLTELRNAALSEDEYTQLGMLKTFYALQETSKEVVNNINASKIDVNGYGKNATSMLITKNLINGLLKGKRKQGKLVGFETKLERNGKPTTLGAIKNNLYKVEAMMQATPELFLTTAPGVQATFNEISNQIYGQNLRSQKLADKLNASFTTYVMSGFPALQTTSREKVDLLTKLPQKVQEIKKQLKDSDNKFLEELEVKIGDDNINYLVMSNQKKSPEYENEIIHGWEEVLDLFPEIGDELVKYSFITSGFNMTINQFYTYIPYTWFSKNNINDHIKNVANDYSNAETLDQAFIQNFYRHNHTDYAVVPLTFAPEVKEYKNKVAGFILLKNDKKADEPVRKFLRKKIYVSPGNGRTEEIEKIYELQGADAKGNLIYTYAVPLGQKDSRANRIYEYNYKDPVKASLLPANNFSKEGKKVVDEQVKAMKNLIVALPQHKREELAPESATVYMQPFTPGPKIQAGGVTGLEQIPMPIVVSKIPTINIEELTADELIKAKIKQNRQKKEIDDLERLIRCLWGK